MNAEAECAEKPEPVVQKTESEIFLENIRKREQEMPSQFDKNRQEPPEKTQARQKVKNMITCLKEDLHEAGIDWKELLKKNIGGGHIQIDYNEEDGYCVLVNGGCHVCAQSKEEAEIRDFLVKAAALHKGRVTDCPQGKFETVRVLKEEIEKDEDGFPYARVVRKILLVCNGQQYFVCSVYYSCIDGPQGQPIYGLIQEYYRILACDFEKIQLENWREFVVPSSWCEKQAHRGLPEKLSALLDKQNTYTFCYSVSGVWGRALY